MDYSSAHYIAITQGKVAIYNDFFFILHTTNLTEYREIVNENEDYLNKQTDTTWRHSILKQQTDEISHIIKTLEIPRRIARSINILGSALKIIAGTPDHDDYELLSTKTNMLIENGNRQTNINSVLQDRINVITNQINILRNNFQNNLATNESKLGMLSQFLINRNYHIINHLKTISLSIILARSNIINPLLLDDIEIKHIIDLDKMPISINNLFTVTKIKVFQSNDVIRYILKIPQVENFCELVTVYPVIQKNKIIRLDTNQAAKCENYTQPLTACNLTSTFNICRPSFSKCISQILNHDKATCPTETTHHLPPIQEIKDGIIILNNVPETNITEQHTITVKGTFLLLFNKQIQINNTLYKSNEINRKIFTEAHPPKLLSIKQIDHQFKISLPYLHEININNTHHIDTIYQQLLNHRSITWTCLLASSIIIIALLLCTTRIFVRRRTRKIDMDKIIQSLKVRNEDVPNLKRGGVNA